MGAGVGDEDGDAVGGLDAEQKVRNGGHGGVAAQDGFAFRRGEREVGGVDGRTMPVWVWRRGRGGLGGFRRRP